MKILKKKKKKDLKHPTDWLKEKESQTARDNVTALMAGKCSFSPGKSVK